MRLPAFAACAAVLALSCADAAFAAAASRPAVRSVTFAGSSVRVPADWPVFDLAAAPHTCMRYDRHAVYLGDPGPDQDCPAVAVGRTETVRIASDGTVSRTHGERTSAEAGSGGGDAHAHADADADATDQVPQPIPKTHARRPRRKLEPAAVYAGLGFDTCAAPSTDVMQAWAKSSPYHATGVYIGGVDRACPDGNLTPDWLRRVSGQGWKFFPIYVGRQAPCWKDPGGGHPALIERARRWTQGVEAADDAADRAGHFGIAQGSPIYFDMEYYPRDNPACTEDVQAFLSAWTDQLHNRGFISGIYSSSGGAIADMALVYDSGAAYRADVAWFAHWDKKPRLFGDPTLNDRYWPGHRRIKQYVGSRNETYGGKRLNIDLNVLDAPVAALK
ncbi:DUF1906 domain-containing protein [Catenulispora subtropica]|uniref:Rv2525c-like glycoside hydrolase-like domain-containing protein n=1 Tax=Catenulispora subtropica TaxID=450798 RepID=A0ABN2QU02_9ACTN